MCQALLRLRIASLDVVELITHWRRAQASRIASVRSYLLAGLDPVDPSCALGVRGPAGCACLTKPLGVRGGAGDGGTLQRVRRELPAQVGRGHQRPPGAPRRPACLPELELLSAYYVDCL